MKRFLLQHIDRILTALGLVLLLALSAKTLHNLSIQAATETPQELRLEGADLTALYTLNAGMNKPAILNRRGDALVEFSGGYSYAVIDGVASDLWSHAFNIELDRARNRAFLTWSSLSLRQDDPEPRHMRRYQIEQVVTLAADRAVVEYFIIPNEPIKKVDLTIGIYKWYFQDLQRGEGTFSFLSPDLTRLDAERRIRPRRLTSVTVQSFPPPFAIQPLVNEFGLYALDLSYATTAPRPYQRTLVARLEATVSGSKAGPPP